MNEAYLLNEIHRLQYVVAEMQNQLANVIKIGRTTTATDEATGTANVQVQHSPFDTHTGIEIAQQFGHASAPPVGSAVITVAIGGDANKKFVVATHNDGLRPQNIPAGGSVQYDAAGTQVSLPNDGTIILKIGDTTILKATKDGIEITGTLTASKDITSTGGDVVASGHSLDNHKHNTTAAGSPTSTPVG